MNPPRPAGFSFVELLVAIFLLGTGLLSLAHLQLAAIQRNGSAFDTQSAMAVAQVLVERMRDNVVGVAEGAYGDGSPPASIGTDCALAPCSPAERASWDLRQTWRSLGATVSAAQGLRGLSQAGVRIECVDEHCDPTSPRSVTVTWASPHETATGLAPARCRFGGDCIRLVLTP